MAGTTAYPPSHAEHSSLSPSESSERRLTEQIRPDNRYAEVSGQAHDMTTKSKSITCEKCLQHKVKCLNPGDGTVCKSCDVLDIQCVYSAYEKRSSTQCSTSSLLWDLLYPRPTNIQDRAYRVDVESFEHRRDSLGLDMYTEDKIRLPTLSKMHSAYLVQEYRPRGPHSSALKHGSSLQMPIEFLELTRDSLKRPTERLDAHQLLGPEIPPSPAYTLKSHIGDSSSQGQLPRRDIQSDWQHYPYVSHDSRRENLSNSERADSQPQDPHEVCGGRRTCLYPGCMESVGASSSQDVIAYTCNWHGDHGLGEKKSPSSGTSSAILEASIVPPKTTLEISAVAKSMNQPRQLGADASKVTSVEDKSTDNVETSQHCTDGSDEGTWGSFSSGSSSQKSNPDGKQNVFSKSAASLLLQIYTLQDRGSHQAGLHSPKKHEPSSDRPTGDSNAADTTKSTTVKSQAIPRKRRRASSSQDDDGQEEGEVPEPDRGREGPLAKKQKRRLFACPFLYHPLYRCKCRAPNIDTISHLTWAKFNRSS